MIQGRLTALVEVVDLPRWRDMEPGCVNVFPALKGGDFLYRWATFRPDKENVSSRVHVAIMRATAV